MKTKNMKAFTVCVLFAFFAITIASCNQAKKTKEDLKKEAKLDKTNVPKEVTDAYTAEYSTPNGDENWYGFPAYDYQSHWYDNWFEYGPYSSTNKPEYFEIDFNKDNTPYKTIYTNSGNKIAVHKSLGSDLPKAVSDSISKSAYKDWTIGKDNEEIYKDADKDQMKVYKVNIEKGNDKHILFFQQDGKLLKDKNLAVGNEQAKVEKNVIPGEIINRYSMDYPISKHENWYGYPAYDYQNDWYEDWYDYGPYSYTQYPDYYVVDFSSDNTPYKAIFSKSGEKIATHKSLTSDLPKAVSDAISNGEYNGWMVGKDKEEIYKDKDKDQLKVYKVDVKKGGEVHILFFQSDGKLLKDKKVH